MPRDSRYALRRAANAAARQAFNALYAGLPSVPNVSPMEHLRPRAKRWRAAKAVAKGAAGVGASYIAKRIRDYTITDPASKRVNPRGRKRRKFRAAGYAYGRKRYGRKRKRRAHRYGSARSSYKKRVFGSTWTRRLPYPPSDYHRLRHKHR